MLPDGGEDAVLEDNEQLVGREGREDVVDAVGFPIGDSALRGERAGRRGEGGGDGGEDADGERRCEAAEAVRGAWEARGELR